MPALKCNRLANLSIGCNHLKKRYTYIEEVLMSIFSSLRKEDRDAVGLLQLKLS